MTTPTPAITFLHACYVRLTGLTLTLTMPRHYAWEVWLSKGWTETDLAAVIGRLKYQIRQQVRTERCLAFSNLIERTESFEETLAEARQAQRVPRQDAGKAQVLKDTSRPCPTPEIATVKTAKEALKSALLTPEWRELARLRDSL